jgi:ubiquitin-protein ligase
MSFDPDIYLMRLLEDKKDLANLNTRCPLVQCRSSRLDLIEVRFEVAGLHRLPNGEIVTAREHFAEIYCPPEYPVFAGPLVRLTTPDVQHWHPNVDPLTGFICD